MIRPAALMMAIAMGGVTTGTYYGLSLLPPGLIPAPIGRAPPDASATPPPAAAAAAAPAIAAPAPAAPAPAAEQPLTEADIAEVPPAELEVASAAPARTTGAAPAEESSARQPYAAPPALVDEPVAAARPPPARAKAPATEAAATREPPTQTASAAKPRAAPPEADLIKPWWPDPARMPAEQLKLQYAGQVQGERAIALLFSAALDLGTLQQHARVLTADGEPVGGSWELGKNPRLAVYRGVDSGRYTVILPPQVADTKGFMLGQTLQGPVYIRTTP